MLQTLSSAPPPAPAFLATSTESEVDLARRYIRAARECRLVLAPWLGIDAEPCVLVVGQQMDGPNDFSAGMDRLMAHPDGRLNRTVRKGLVHTLLCGELGLDPADPALCDKVNAIYREPDQVAS